MLKKLYTQIDFLNLTTDDINNITKILDLSIPEDQDKYEFLFNNLDNIEANSKALNIVNNKLLAGQVTVKWYKFSYDNEITKEILREKLESKELAFNADSQKRILLELKDEKKDSIVSTISEESIYTIKTFIFDGYKRNNNGIQFKKEAIMKSVIVKIDIEKCWVEIRTSDERSIKVIKLLESKLGLKDIKCIRILNKYLDVNSFKDSLVDGFYLNYKAAPSEIIKLTEEDGVTIYNIITSIDDYLINRDVEDLEKRLNKIKYDSDGLSFSSLLLAGIDSLGMKIRNDSEKDMSNQSLYTILKDHFIEDSSHIKFKNFSGGDEYTMRVGLKTNSIVFKSSVTEDVIIYIREKIL